MEQIRLGSEDWLEQKIGGTTLERLLEEDVDTVLDHAQWREDTRYDDGWTRAGAESFYRVGYDNEEPVFIQKSGTPRRLLMRGQALDKAGGVVIPTVMEVVEDAVDDVCISGKDYTTIQDYIPTTFMERYEDGEVSEQAIEDLGRNVASLYSEGFTPVRPERKIDEMLSDGQHTYLVDFGSDLKTESSQDRDEVYFACLDRLESDDFDSFKEGYRFVRGDLGDTSPHDNSY